MQTPVTTMACSHLTVLMETAILSLLKSSKSAAQNDLLHHTKKHARNNSLLTKKLLFNEYLWVGKPAVRAPSSVP
jgi:hypothetical protein